MSAVEQKISIPRTREKNKQGGMQAPGGVGDGHPIFPHLPRRPLQVRNLSTESKDLSPLRILAQLPLFIYVDYLFTHLKFIHLYKHYVSSFFMKVMPICF